MSAETPASFLPRRPKRKHFKDEAFPIDLEAGETPAQRRQRLADEAVTENPRCGRDVPWPKR